MQAKYKIKPTNKFAKQLKKISKQGKDINLLKNAIKALSLGEQLPERFRDHSLIGEWNGFRECHIEPNWLLIYKKYEDILVLELVQTGSHADLF